MRDRSYSVLELHLSPNVKNQYSESETTNASSGKPQSDNDAKHADSNSDSQSSRKSNELSANGSGFLKI